MHPKNVVEPETPSAAIHIALIGSTSAGKTTLARGVVEACRNRGFEAWLSEDFAARHVGIHWIRSAFARRRLLELASLFYSLASWSRYRAYHGLAVRLIRDAPGSWIYKADLLRLTLRKTGIHEIVRRHAKAGQVVISDNEPALQGAHHLFVHPNGSKASGLRNGSKPNGVEAFADLAPLTDVVVYLQTSAPVVVERTLRRGHRRLGSRSIEDVGRMVRDTIDVFDRVSRAPSLRDRLLISDGRTVMYPREAAGEEGTERRFVARVIEDGFEAARASRRARYSEADTIEPESDLGQQLVARLNQGVSYCCWMGDSPVSGRVDVAERLRILVDPSDLDSVRQILAELRFKEAHRGPGPRTPGEWHYFGLDPTTGSLMHVHVFGRVLIGMGRRRSHRLPLEAMLLDHVELRGAVRVPRGAAELVLFVLRSFAEAGPLSSSLGVPRWGDDTRARLRRIEVRSTVADAVALLKTHLPQFEEGLFLECLGELRKENARGPRILLARRVRRQLRAYEIRSAVGRLRAFAEPLGALGRRDVARINETRWASGGALIAFVGPDATGKSTMARATAEWLKGACGVRIVHLGKPSSSLGTMPINLALRVWRALRGRRPRWQPDAPREEASVKVDGVGWSILVYALRAAVLAVDRRRAVRKVWLSATRGDVVVCDRYPTAQLGAMDGPRLESRPGATGARAVVYRWLARWEGRLYQAVPPPDVLIRLTVSVETAKQRNRDRDKADKHTDEDLESRHQSLGTWSIRNDRRRDVSTEGSLAETLMRVKKAIWEVL